MICKYDAFIVPLQVSAMPMILGIVEQPVGLPSLPALSLAGSLLCFWTSPSPLSLMLGRRRGYLAVIGVGELGGCKVRLVSSQHLAEHGLHRVGDAGNPSISRIIIGVRKSVSRN